MNFSNFFIRRPIFAGVLSTLIFVVGLIAMWRLPISEYPEVVPPTIVVRATYPGANPKTISETVASPLEQAINGVEDSLYMFSQATGDGVMALTVTFKLGTDIDKAQVQVQNRVSQALPKLPEEVRRARRHDDETVARPDDGGALVLAERSLRRSLSAQLRHVAGEGCARAHSRRGRSRCSVPATTRCAFGSIPDKVAAPKSDRERSRERDSRTERAGRRRRNRPTTGRATPSNFELQINAKGRLIHEEEFGQIIVKTGPNGEKTLLKDVARIELGASGYALRSLLNNKTAVAMPIFQMPGANALQLSERCSRDDGRAETEFSGRHRLLGRL